MLIDMRRAAIGNEVCDIFGISKCPLQNYRGNRQIPNSSIGEKILYPQFEIYR